MNAAKTGLRLGIDLGGTKIEGIALDADNNIVAGPIRVATPRHDYAATLDAIVGLVENLEAQLGISSDDGASVGMGIPGSIVRATGRVQNANSVWLNGRPLAADLTSRLSRPVRIANDANCFALSEAVDGAAADAHTVFGVILGTGCGGGLVLGRQVINGPMGIGGEWGHNPLPWAREDETPGPRCWCGRLGCMEQWVAGPAIEGFYEAASGQRLRSSAIAKLGSEGDPMARRILDAHTDRLARGLAHVMNIFDPDVVVLGGGLSKLDHLYRELPPAIERYVFADHPVVDLRPPRWGDSGGVRGAAWLWNSP
ncbi:MAG: ROK family protein [Alphaproteobacteria bacterium]|nr:ROK family protein [Alphaproteobacteria bacterium]